MLYLKACEKCQGDLTLEKDLYGAYFRCLQCGRNMEAIAKTLTEEQLVGAIAAELAA